VCCSRCCLSRLNLLLQLLQHSVLISLELHCRQMLLISVGNLQQCVCLLLLEAI
jgi:hypothetical protein